MKPSNLGMQGDLASQLIRSPKPHSARAIRIPGLGRVILTRDPGDSLLLAREYFMSRLQAIHRRDGELVHAYDLGSGLVTNVGVTAMANDFAWAQNAQTLKLANWHASGIGATAAAATDIALQTLAGPTTTKGVAGTQTLVSEANKQTYKTVATIIYTESLAITEWGLLTAEALGATTGTPFTAAAAKEATVTGTPYSASSGSVQGEQQLIVKAGTTTVYGLILSNSTSKLIIPAWYKVADGTAGSTPGNTEAFTLLPVLWDHKVFAPINVVNTDEITFKYSLALSSGG